MNRAEAKKLATELRTNCEKPNRPTGKGSESKTWDLALDVLLEWAREKTADVKLSRNLLSLASWVVGSNKRREKIYEEARTSPELALKCSGCGADQDAWGSTCDENKKKHHDACGWCDLCPDCDESETWVRPNKNERLAGGASKWETQTT